MKPHVKKNPQSGRKKAELRIVIKAKHGAIGMELKSEVRSSYGKVGGREQRGEKSSLVGSAGGWE